MNISYNSFIIIRAFTFMSSVFAHPWATSSLGELPAAWNQRHGCHR